MSELGIVAGRVAALSRRTAASDDGTPDIDTLVHDLRGPLSVIVAFAESIESAEREERARFVERLLANAHRALAVLEEFAALCDLRSGEIEAYVRPMDLAEVARLAAESTAQRGRRGVEIACLVPPDGLLMLGDRDLLGMALRAVLRAVAHVLVGAGSLRLHVVGEGDFGAVELRVSDRRQVRGQSLRAAIGEFEILERVVSLHGGQIVFDRADPESVFRVTMPRQPRSL